MSLVRALKGSGYFFTCENGECKFYIPRHFNSLHVERSVDVFEVTSTRLTPPPTRIVSVSIIFRPSSSNLQIKVIPDVLKNPEKAVEETFASVDEVEFKTEGEKYVVKFKVTEENESL